MSKPETAEQASHLRTAVDDILATITQDREKEIIARRFGLQDRKETLEQIGDMLGITRERVRQLEKSILTRLRSTIANGAVASVPVIEKSITLSMAELCRAASIHDLASHMLQRNATPIEKAHVAFISELLSSVTMISENDSYYQSAAMVSLGDEKAIRARVEEIVSYIKKHGQPVTADKMYASMSYEHPVNITALAGVSKKLAHLRGKWGLVRWPSVNPKNIRDKIFVVLDNNKKPMHFSEIAEAIKNSEFKRKNVTTQAIHNELIKDKRFVLIGRGIYALESWGYSRGTVADIITDVLKEAGQPLHRDEIVKRVLDKRQVKETTILLNLQAKSQFKRTAKATYTVAEAA